MRLLPHSKLQIIKLKIKITTILETLNANVIQRGLNLTQVGQHLKVTDFLSSKNISKYLSFSNKHTDTSNCW